MRVPRAGAPDPKRLADSGDAQALAEALASPAAQLPAAEPREARRRRTARPIARVLFVSHSDFTGSSAVHVYRLATELHARGLSPAIAVPGDPDTVEDLGRPAFPVISFADARAGRFERPDLVHAFTPRERVRKLTAHVAVAAACPYVVHLEDNDAAVLSAELDTSVEQLAQLPAVVLDRFVGEAQVHPLRGAHFVQHAAAVTVVIERLLERVPEQLPSAVVTPGFDDAVLAPRRARDDVRAELGIGADDYAVLYTGTIHAANVPDVRRLYVALAALRLDGHPIVFVKTGWTAPAAPELRQLGDAVRDLGWLPRAALPDLLNAADLLVQPGVPGPFNDYRFPAKLPDFLASGKPVLVSRTNLGVTLRHEREAFVVESGTSAEIYRAIELLRAQPELARRIGDGGREFALRQLRWSAAADAVQALYAQLEESAPPEPARLELPPPVQVLALVSDAPSEEEERVARRHGVYGFRRAGEADDVVPFDEDYETRLRRRVLQALARHESSVLVDPRGPLTRTAWLRATRTALRDGICRYYTSRGLTISARSVESMLTLEGPPTRPA